MVFSCRTTALYTCFEDRCTFTREWKWPYVAMVLSSSTLSLSLIFEINYICWFHKCFDKAEKKETCTAELFYSTPYQRTDKLSNEYENWLYRESKKRSSFSWYHKIPEFFSSVSFFLLLQHVIDANRTKPILDSVNKTQFKCPKCVGMCWGGDFFVRWKTPDPFWF